MLPGAPVTDSDLMACRRQMFLDFCALLDRESIAYVILSGYQSYPDRIESDVDFMVSAVDFARLPGTLGRPGSIPGAQLLQRLQHEATACYYVFAKQVGERLAYLHPDAASDYRRRGRLWLSSDSVLASRRLTPAGFWVPAAAVEFEYYLVKRIDKLSLGAAHVARLAALMWEDEPGCLAAASRLLRPDHVHGLQDALQSSDVAWFAEHGAALRRDLAAAMPRESFVDRMTSRLADARRVLQRLRQPTGFVIAVLGPDGSGKTTVIEHLERELAPAFRQVRRFHLRPHFGKALGRGVIVREPHSQAPRSALASLLKTMLFVVDYWWGWLRIIWPARVRSTLVIFDRYYHDMLVDPRRYRLPPHYGFYRSMATSVPRPDLWIVLTASPDVLIARKGEITRASAAELVQAYRMLAHQYGSGSFETDVPLAQTLAGVVAATTEPLQTRTSARIGTIG